MYEAIRSILNDADKYDAMSSQCVPKNMFLPLCARGLPFHLDVVHTYLRATKAAVLN